MRTDVLILIAVMVLPCIALAVAIVRKSRRESDIELRKWCITQTKTSNGYLVLTSADQAYAWVVDNKKRGLPFGLHKDNP